MHITPLDKVQSHYDAIVVGSGLGGLTCANRLAAAGHSVLLLEHHIQLGGLATWFKRGGHIFDVSLHGFPYGMVKTCKKYWGKPIRDAIVQLKNIVFDNPQFSLTTTFSKEDFVRILQERFGVRPAVVDEFFATVDGMNFYDDQRMTTRELFTQFFPRPQRHPPAADGADHLCQRLDPGRAGHYLRHRFLQLHEPGGVHL